MSICTICFDGHPYDDDYDTHYGYCRELDSIEAAKAEAFESLSPDFAVTISAEILSKDEPDDYVLLSRWSPKNQRWTDRKKNIQEAFNDN